MGMKLWIYLIWFARYLVIDLLIALIGRGILVLPLLNVLTISLDAGDLDGHPHHPIFSTRVRRGTLSAFLFFVVQHVIGRIITGTV